VHRAAWLGERPPPQEGVEAMTWYAGRAALRGIAPRDALEGLLAAQMVAVHEAAMGCFHRAHDRGYAPGLRQAELARRRSWCGRSRRSSRRWTGTAARGGRWCGSST
jgi:hypothetical protein